ncbi:histidine phosphatase family protein [Vibrio sinaloensis]|uniref:histidine phosphatase family protein n=1 Tax=Photobacterium sp. (strain ATCC 43367) TaxID=379097 RepID=UPI0005800B78|nr:histidine phosphatase family protein [Vibrio sinaloensis]KHT40235.1 alpha-ribazole phosphatase [Vibrio sinaloensis]
MDKVVNIYLLRHGKTVGAPALYGHTDVAVDDQTQQQIYERIKASAMNIERVISSPLKRCAQLAQFFDASPANIDVAIWPALKEMHFGELDGVPFDAAKSFWPELEQFWHSPAENTLPGAENLSDFYTRITKSWEQLVTDVEQDTLVICHGGTIRMILASLLPFDWQDSRLYSTLHIGHQTISHIQIIKADAIYERVCSIGAPIESSLGQGI